VTKFWNLAVSAEDDGAKVLDVHIVGVIDGGWLDESSTSTAEIAKALAEHKDAKKINVRINSVGGSAFGGIALYNILQAHGAEVTSYVDGLAMSAASIVAMAGRTVMGRGAMLMIHNPWLLVAGDARELRQAAAVLDKVRDSLLAVYKAKTGKDGTALKAMLDAETWMTAEQALRQGFADAIVDGDDKPNVEDFGDLVAFNSEPFPRTALPKQILAMAKPSTPVPPQNQPPKGGGTTSQETPNMKLTKEILAKEAPELLAALLDEGKAAGVDEGKKVGHADGVKAERARLKAIDELAFKGCDEMVLAAKYGDKPCEARDLAYEVAKAGKLADAGILAARRNESAVAASVKHTPPSGADSELGELLDFGRNYVKALNDKRGK
jgi:ATP-dependent protease ClpP protease subunit